LAEDVAGAGDRAAADLQRVAVRRTEVVGEEDRRVLGLRRVRRADGLAERGRGARAGVEETPTAVEVRGDGRTIVGVHLALVPLEPALPHDGLVALHRRGADFADDVE